jgi:hypothetical protein
MGVATLTEKQRLAMEALKGARGEGARPYGLAIRDRSFQERQQRAVSVGSAEQALR